MGIMVNTNHNTAYNLTVTNDTVGLSIRLIDSLFDGITRDNLAVLLIMVITQTEFFRCTILECLLIVEDKLVTV